MNEIPNMEQYREQIEKLSTTYSEKDGMPPVCGRIVNYLLLKKNTEATFEELCSYFKVSKSAVSNALTRLEQKKLVASKTRHGQRKRYFTLHFKSDELLQTIHQHQSSLKNYLENIIALRNGQEPIDHELKEALKIINIVISKFPELIALSEKK